MAICTLYVAATAAGRAMLWSIRLPGINNTNHNIIIIYEKNLIATTAYLYLF